MKIEHTEVYGFRAALRGMRNPFDSWDKSDSEFFLNKAVCLSSPVFFTENVAIGPKDLELASKLIRQGGDHRKFLRFIVIWCDFVLPRYVWQEVDTYKVGTVRNSCSTMNMLGKRVLEQSDFESGLPEAVLDELNKAVQDFSNANKSMDKSADRVRLKGILPEGYLQRATYLMNYEVAFRMYFSRRQHRLPMWRENCEGSICEWIKSLPYMQDFIEAGKQKWVER